jgi:hypothetical protein
MRLVLARFILLSVLPNGNPAALAHEERITKKDTTQGHESEQKEPRPPSVIFQTNIDCQTCAQQTGHKTGNAEHPAHHRIDWLTVAIAIFAGVTAGAMCRQIKTARDAERAWMIADMDPLPDDSPRRDQPYRMVCRIKNMGRTPARLFAKGERRDLQEKTYIPPGKLPEYENMMCWRDGAILPPGGEMVIILYLLSDEIGPVYAGDRSLWIHGFANYRDVFNRPHETRYCFHYRPGLGGKDPATVGFYPDGPAAYNKAT